MTDLNHSFPEILYHTYIVEGDPENDPFVLRSFFEGRSEIAPLSPDVLIGSYDSLSVADAGYIKEWHKDKSSSDEKRMCIIGAKFINREAEHSLLKILEEPQENTHFFLVVPNIDLLLDTIKSRSHVVRIQELVDEHATNAVTFVKAPVSIRIEMVTEIIKKHEDADTSGAVRHDAIKFLNALEQIIYKKFQTDQNNRDIVFVLDEFRKSKEYLSTPGASVKMILEHIALVI